MLILLNSQKSQDSSSERKVKELLMQARVNYSKLKSVEGESLCNLALGKIMYEKCHIFTDGKDEEMIYRRAYEFLNRARRNYEIIENRLGEFTCIKYLNLIGNKLKGEFERSANC